MLIQAIAAVAKMEQWKWDDAKRFITSSPRMLGMLLRSPMVLPGIALPKAHTRSAELQGAAAPAGSRAASTQGGSAVAGASEAATAPVRPTSRASGSILVGGHSADPCTAQSQLLDLSSRRAVGSSVVGLPSPSVSASAQTVENIEAVPWLVQSCIGRSDLNTITRLAEDTVAQGTGVKKIRLDSSTGASVSHAPAQESIRNSAQTSGVKA